MYCAVYRLRHREQPLTKPEVLSTKVLGWVTFEKHKLGLPMMVAYLAPFPAPLGERRLEPAEVRQVTHEGMLIGGRERIPGDPSDGTRQVWWCGSGSQRSP